VITHTDNVSVPGWSGVGYIIVNPKTGDGGYYISGGENGGFALLAAASLILWIALGTISLFPAAANIAVLVIGAALLLMIAGTMLIVGNKQACFVAAQLAIAIITKASLFKHGRRLLALLAPILGLSSISAWKLCHCNEGPPYCLDFIP
jgi:hypothetical protein